MTMRRWILGVIAGLACSAAMAKPPSGPLSEGREVDPVVRDFQLGETPAVEGTAPSRAAEKNPSQFVEVWLTLFCDVILNRLTMPLGPVSPVESR